MGDWQNVLQIDRLWEFNRKLDIIKNRMHGSKRQWLTTLMRIFISIWIKFGVVCRIVLKSEDTAWNNEYFRPIFCKIPGVFRGRYRRRLMLPPQQAFLTKKRMKRGAGHREIVVWEERRFWLLNIDLWRWNLRRPFPGVCGRGVGGGDRYSFLLLFLPLAICRYLFKI